MNRTLFFSMRWYLFIFVIASSSFGSAFSAAFDDSEVTHIDYPDWFEDSPFFDLEENLKNARATGKRGLMVLFTTEGCSYCDVFIRRSLGDPAIAAMVQKDFDSVGLEIFDDTEMTSPRGVSMPVKEFAKSEKVQFSPTLLFFGDEGERILRVVGYQSPERFRMILGYLAGDHYRTASLGEYRTRISESAARLPVSAGLRDDPLFSKPPYVLDRSHFPASRPLLVIFEKRGCNECEGFHTNVLALKEVRDMLMKFEIVRLDVDDDRTPILAPDGRRVTPAAWFEQTGFTREPALLFFDEAGTEVLRTDALVLGQRMMNSLTYVLERAYEKGWTYQRFARSKGMERHRNVE